jgi:hypothetical protein
MLFTVIRIVKYCLKSGISILNNCGQLLGLVMAGTSVPQLIAYAETVGYASYRGLSTAGPSLIAWGLATGSPWMNSGVTSMTALMAKVDLNGEAFLASNTEEAYVDLVAAYSFWVGFASIFLAIVGFGKLAGLTPKPVSAGFKVRSFDYAFPKICYCFLILCFRSYSFVLYHHVIRFSGDAL